MAIPMAFLALFVVACLGAWEVIAVLVTEEMSALETVIGDGIGPGDDPRFEIVCGEGCGSDSFGPTEAIRLSEPGIRSVCRLLGATVGEV